MTSAYDARQNRSGLIPSWAEFAMAALPESSLQGTSADLQSALTLLLSRIDKMESHIANVTNKLLHKRITAQEQDKVFLHPDSLEYQGDDLGEGVNLSSEELRPVNMEKDFTVGEIVRNQAEVMFIGNYSLVAGLFDQNSPVLKTSGHLSSHSPS